MPLIHQIGTIRIYIYAADHNPPHFHARAKDGVEAIIRISDLSVMLDSGVSGKVLREVLAWALDNQELLRLRWNELRE